MLLSGQGILTRLATELGLSVNERGWKTELARTIGINADLLHQWWRRDKVGLDEVVGACIKHDLDLNQVLAGRRASGAIEHLEFLPTNTPSDPILTLDKIGELASHAASHAREALLKENKK